MSKRSLVLTLALCSAALATVRPAHAATPGSPVIGGQPPTIKIREFRDQLGFNKEIYTVDLALQGIAGGVCDGYVVLQNPSDAAVLPWSDVVVFHDGANLPSGACNATVHFMTIVSDRNAADHNEGIPTAGCLLQPGTLVPPCTPTAEFTQPLGQTNLANLTAEIVNAAIGAPSNPTVFQPEGFLPVGGSGLNYAANAVGTAGGPGLTVTYAVTSDIPALPPWAFLLLGGVLAGSAFVVLRRRGSFMTPSA